MDLESPTRHDLLAYYRQQMDIASKIASECTNEHDLNVWKRITDEWQKLHDALAKDGPPQSPSGHEPNRTTI